MGYRNLYGIVTDPNPGSFALHKSLGFSETGREHLAGVKFGEWHDVVLFEKLIAPHEPLTDDPRRMPADHFRESVRINSRRYSRNTGNDHHIIFDSRRFWRCFFYNLAEMCAECIAYPERL